MKERDFQQTLPKGFLVEGGRIRNAEGMICGFYAQSWSGGNRYAMVAGVRTCSKAVATVALINGILTDKY